MKKLIIVALAVSAMQGASAAFIVESFETGVWTSKTGKAASQSTTGATNGTYSMKITDSDGAWTWLGKQWDDPNVFNQWKQNTKLEVDVFTPAGKAHNVNIALAINSAGGWQQIEIEQWPWVNQNVEYKKTLVWDYSSLVASAPNSSSWFQIHIMARTGNNYTPIDYYVDNIRFTGAVPEPASLIALGGGALALIARRRRNK